MPKPLAICIEELGQAESKYMRCVALPGRQPGLRLDEAGQVLWQSEDGVSCELWVSADERLILYRPEGAISVTLHRAGRSLDVPCGKPVVVIDKDQVDVGALGTTARRLRIHVHGEASSVAAPSPLPSEALYPTPHLLGRLAQAVAATALIGAVVATGGCTDQSIEVRQTPPAAPPPSATPTIEVRQFPPTAPPPSATPTIEVRITPPQPTAVPIPTATVGKSSILQVIQGAWMASQVYDVAGERVWITGTLTIQGDSYTFKPTREVSGPSVPGTLDFLFKTPRGQVTIRYGDKVKPDATFEGFVSGDVLANLAFRANSAVVGNFVVKVRDSHTLYFDAGASSLWSVTKQLN